MVILKDPLGFLDPTLKNNNPVLKVAWGSESLIKF